MLIADDLTGACDAAAPFRAQGASVTVVLNFGDAAAWADEVLSVSTDSRDLAIPEMRERLRRAARDLARFEPSIIFKKIDSSLRGNPGEEIAAALEAFQCDIAVITPAFPAMGRLVREEHLFSDRDPAWQPIHVPTLLRSQGLLDCEHVSAGSLRNALTGEGRFLSVDADAHEDLQTVVAETLGCGRRVLWAGSAGLAKALAPALFPVRRTPAAVATRNVPVLFAVGSNHVVTAGQLHQLSTRFFVQQLHADLATPETLAMALQARRHTILKIGRDTTTSERLAELLARSQPEIGAMLLCGGDTAALVCRAVAADSIALEGEIITGVPWGSVEGGLLKQLPVATKSGAFGGPDALIKVAEFFSCLPH